jgi:predicted dehydrogenase
VPVVIMHSRSSRVARLPRLAGAAVAILALVGPAASAAVPATGPIRTGVIGLDAHAKAWLKIIRAARAKAAEAPPAGADADGIAALDVVAAFPAGSPDIPEKEKPLEAGIAAYREAGVEMVDSIEALLPKVDAVMILSVDGRAHLAQARPVIAAGKPLYIDKPIAASLADAREIFRLAAELGTPVFSSSSLRFAPGTQAVLTNAEAGAVVGCDAFSPCTLEAHHPDLFWYGIHGVETLFTLMGPGCERVSRTKTHDTDVVVGTWQDGRIGTFRGLRAGKRGYGATVFCERATLPTGTFEGYEPLIVEIVRFFRTGKPPVPAAETLEIVAFMEAAERSVEQGGKPVPLTEARSENTQSGP